MPKQSLCIFIVVIFKRNLTIIILIRTRSGKYYRVFQCDRNPDKGATQHASGTTLNKPAQKLKKKISETLFIQKNRSVFWPGIFLEDCGSHYRVIQRIVCRIDRLKFICNCSCKLSSFERDAEINPPLAITFTA